jgi:hypothetical protein
MIEQKTAAAKVNNFFMQRVFGGLIVLLQPDKLKDCS